MDSKTHVKLANVEDIPEGKAIIAKAPHGLEVALFKINGNIYALNNECPHMGGPLGEGTIEDCIVTCPWHGWQFDVRTGDCENMPGDDARKIELEVIDGEIFLKD
jgi:nitrite reductase (NADH) small subunit